jgi:hypothetical protein
MSNGGPGSRLFHAIVVVGLSLGADACGGLATTGGAAPDGGGDARKSPDGPTGSTEASDDATTEASPTDGPASDDASDSAFEGGNADDAGMAACPAACPTLCCCFANPDSGPDAARPCYCASQRPEVGFWPCYI